MNFSDIGNLIKDYAPTVGMALSSPVGAVAAIGSIVAKALGSNSDANAIYEAIKQDPVKAQEKIKREIENNIELEKISLEVLKEKYTREGQVDAHEERLIELHNQDVKNARESNTLLNSPNNNNNKVDNFIKVTLAIGILVIVLICICILSFDDNLPTDARTAIQNVMFSFGTLLGAMLQFYFGNPLKQHDVDKMTTDIKTIKSQTNIPKKTY